MTEAEIKYFTPQEANKTLPLVKKIVKDILDYSLQLRTIIDSTGGKVDDNSEAQYYIEQLKGFMKELEEIGCYYKDWNFAVGLVDFPAIIEEEEVFLCWRSDEEKVMYYHRIQDGYKGRKMIPDYYFEETSV